MPASLPSAPGARTQPDSWVHATARFRERPGQGPTDMQGLLAAREGQSARPRPGRQAAVCVGVSEEMTCTKTSAFRFPARPGIRSQMNRMARHSGPQGGLSFCPGRRGRGDPPPILLLPQGRYYSHRHPKEMAWLRRGPGRRLCNYRAHRAQTSALAFPVPTCWAGCPGCSAPTLGHREGRTLSQAPPAGSAAQGGSGLWNGWRPGPEQRAATVVTVCVPCVPPCPAHQDTGQLRLSTRGPGRLCRGTGCRCAAMRCG